METENGLHVFSLNSCNGLYWKNYMKGGGEEERTEMTSWPRWSCLMNLSWWNTLATLDQPLPSSSSFWSLWCRKRRKSTYVDIREDLSLSLSLDVNGRLLLFQLAKVLPLLLLPPLEGPHQFCPITTKWHVSIRLSAASAAAFGSGGPTQHDLAEATMKLLTLSLLVVWLLMIQQCSNSSCFKANLKLMDNIYLCI